VEFRSGLVNGLPIVPCCELEEIATISSGWRTTVRSEAAGDNIATVPSACVQCGRLTSNLEWRLSESSLFQLRARERIGHTGNWRSLQLPRFHRLGRTIGDDALILRTIRNRRLREKIENLTLANLEGLIRKHMGLPSSLWPRSIPSPGWHHPIIVHHGLALKFATKKDVNHVFLCGYIYDVIKYPTEVWLGTHHERPRLRFLRKLRTEKEHYTLLVSVDPTDSIVATAYILDDQQHEVNREGVFCFASWTAPI
jgi:hypothetical protein